MWPGIANTAWSRRESPNGTRLLGEPLDSRAQSRRCAQLFDPALRCLDRPAVSAMLGNAGLRPAQRRCSRIAVKDTRLVAELLARSEDLHRVAYRLPVLGRGWTVGIASEGVRHALAVEQGAHGLASAVHGARDHAHYLGDRL